MPSALTDVSSFDTVTGPVAADIRNAASIRSALQTVANRTRYLLDQLVAELTTRDAADAILEPGLRLTLTTGTPVADSAATSTIYYTPYRHARIGLWTGALWVTKLLASDASLALSGLTTGKNYDVFAYWTGAVVALELSAAWTNDTTRADALARRDGVLVKSADHTRRYVGTFRAVSATTTADSTSTRFLWNAYHRVRRTMIVQSSAIWTYSTVATWRQANASASNQVEFVCGDVSAIDARVQAVFNNSSGAYVTMGIGIDSTTVNSATLYGSGAIGTTPATAQQVIAEYRGQQGPGYFKLAWLERVSGGTLTMNPANDGTVMASGMLATVEG